MELRKIMKRRLSLAELLKQKKGQTGGLVTGLIFGVTSLVIGVIIAYVIISTLTSANLLTSSRPDFSVVQEVGHINATGYTLAEFSATNAISSTFAISIIINESEEGTIPSANYTLNLTSGSVQNVSGFWDSVNISYGYKKYSNEELSSDALVANLTARGIGADKGTHSSPISPRI